MVRRLLPLLVLAVLVAACGDDGDGLTQPATAEGAAAAAEALQEAALRADEDGIRRGLSAECLDQIDDEELGAVLAFLRLLIGELDVDGIEVRATVTELDGNRADVSVEYLEDGEPVEPTDDAFSLSAEDMTLIHDGTRWVSDDCDFGGSDAGGTQQCLDASGQLTGCPDPATNGRDDPVPLGQAAYLGGGWTMRVVSVDPDAIDTIEAESGFSSDLDDGVQAVLIDLEMAFIGDDEPSNPFSVSLGGVGSSNVGIDTFGCGFLPEPIDGSADVFTGGLVRGQQCLPTPADEVDGVLLYAEVFGEEQIFFDLRGTAVDDALPSARGPVPGSRHEDSRLAPEPFGQAAEAGEWTVTVTDADLDATDAVLDASSFASEPAAGHQYVLLDFTATYDGAEPASSSQIRPDLLTDANIGFAPNCPTGLDDEFDGFAEVFPGGTLSGSLCYEVPSDEVDGLLAVVQPDPFGDDIVFIALG